MIKLNSNIEQFKKNLLKEFWFASLVAINDAAFAISRDLNDTTSLLQGGANAFTKKSFFVSEKANKDKITK